MRGVGLPLDPNAPAAPARRTTRDTLPITARSLTEAEVAALESRMGRILFPIILGMLWMLIIPLLFTGGRQAESLRGIMLPMGIFGTLFIWLVWQWRQKRQRRHCATPILVEVGADRLTLTSEGQIHHINYDGLVWHLLTWGGELDTYFVGIRLETPLGELRLEDGCFERGADAAAAIVRLAGRGDSLPPRLG